MKDSWPVSLSCEVLGVSVSGYFEHERRRRQRRPSQPGSGRLSDEALLAHIRAIHAEVRQEYGWPRMTKELCARGHRVGKERVRRLMQQHGIKARGRRKFVVTTDSKHDLPIAQDLLQRNFTADGPNAKWTSDITYIATDEGWLYLAAFIDLHSRMVVGWSMQPHMRRASSYLSRHQAAIGLLLPRATAALTTSVRSGLRVTVSMCDQLRVALDHRRGLSWRARM